MLNSNLETEQADDEERSRTVLGSDSSSEEEKNENINRSVSDNRRGSQISNFDLENFVFNNDASFMKELDRSTSEVLE